MGCTCNTCETESVTPSCPACACKGDSVVIRDDSCAERQLKGIPSGLVACDEEGKVSMKDGSDTNPIDLALVKSELSGKAIFILGSDGKLSALEYSKENEGMFIGFIDGEVKAVNIDSELLRYNEEAIGSENHGFLAVWGCGGDGKITLSKSGLKDCSIALDKDGKVVCSDGKICLVKASDIVYESLALPVLNPDGCLARIDVPQVADKCYEILVVRNDDDNANVIKIVEQQPHIHFIATFPNVLDTTITGVSYDEGEIDLTSRIPEGKCFVAAQLVFECKIEAASRLTATAGVTLGGIPLANLSAYWYGFDTARANIILPLGSTNKISWRVDRNAASNHRNPPTFKVRLISFAQ